MIFDRVRIMLDMLTGDCNVFEHQNWDK